MERLAGIQALRFCAALMVLYAHLFPSFTRIGQHGVEVFFVISGFIMVYSSERLFGRPESVRIFLVNRITRVVPLYWLMTIVMAIYIGGQSWPNIMTSLLFIPHQSGGAVIQPIVTVGWTLNIEMFFYVIFSAWLTFPRNVAIPCACITLISLVLLGLSIQLPESIVKYWTTPLMLWFALGCMLAAANRNGLRMPLTLKPNSLLAKASDFLGNISYALYLTHIFVAWQVGGSPTRQAIAAILAAVPIYFLIELPSTRMLRYIISLRFTPASSVLPGSSVQASISTVSELNR